MAESNLSVGRLGCLAGLFARQIIDWIFVLSNRLQISHSNPTLFAIAKPFNKDRLDSFSL